MRRGSNKTANDDMMLTKTQAGALQNCQSPIDAVMGTVMEAPWNHR
jgi:hypothetical protein